MRLADRAQSGGSLPLVVALACCASVYGYTLRPGESTVHDVEMVMGRPADQRAGPDGQTIYWYPQVPYGRANYAARIGADGTLLAIEQRLVEQNIKQVAVGWSTEQVYDLLGPPYWPESYTRSQRTSWTYPMLVQGYGYPKWFVVYFSTPDKTVVETYLMDDPTAVPRGTTRR
jgi:hypothetical protein